MLVSAKRILIWLWDRGGLQRFKEDCGFEHPTAATRANPAPEHLDYLLADFRIVI